MEFEEGFWSTEGIYKEATVCVRVAGNVNSRFRLNINLSDESGSEGFEVVWTCGVHGCGLKVCSSVMWRVEGMEADVALDGWAKLKGNAVRGLWI